MSARTRDVIVIGAGPYGLAAAAHLRGAGMAAYVFGQTMRFWRTQMPRGMLLRSAWNASHIPDPNDLLTLDAYERESARTLSRPIPLDDFIAYGEWFQRRAVADVDPRRVERVEPVAEGFDVLLEDGERVQSGRVVVATGIASFAWRPPQFDGLPAALCSHSSDHADLARFAGRRVLVVGGGQSALESAVLLREAGADVEVAMRGRRLRWLGRSERLGPLRGLLFHRSDVGPPLLSHVIGHPSLLRQLPAVAQREIARRGSPPAVARWLHSRADGLTITAGRVATSARPYDGEVRVALDDGSERRVHHVLLATGYRIDVGRHAFLGPVLAGVRRVNGYPVLDDGFQSSVRGLHFLGAPAAYSFGPVVRFVSGSPYSTRALARHCAGALGADGVMRRPPAPGAGRVLSRIPRTRRNR